MKNIIITGASRGIGKELAKKHIQAGNNILAISRSESKLKEISDKNNYRYKALDLTDLKEFETLLDLINDWKNIDVLYNNAGLLIKKPFQKLTPDDFLQTWNVNFLAPAMLIQSLLSKMNSNTHIVNISTMGAVQGSVKFPELAAYSSSKSALVNLTELLAEEFEENQPKINAVALGAVQTEMLEQAFPGYEAPLSSEEMANYLYDFGLNGHQYMNGKIIQCALTTP